MAITQWKPVSWVPNEDITDEKLNTMVSNSEFLRAKMVGGKYSAYGVNTDQNVKIIGGISYVAANPKGPTRTLSLTFLNSFAVGCRPVVTTGIYCANARYLMATVQARSGTGAVPDAQGFRVSVAFYSTAKPIKLPACYIGWHALGYG